MKPSTLTVVSLLLLSAPTPAAERWDPGNPTTASLPGEAGASDERGSAGGVYGRFDADLTVSVSGGAELASDPSRGLAKLAGHYFRMAGPYLTLRMPLSKDDDGDTWWLGSAGVDLNPVFIPRWALDLERGPALLDLILDSLALSAGAFVGWGGGSTSRPRGFEAGLGAGVPLFATASGPWLEARYVLAWRHAGAAEPSVWLTLSWQFMVNTPLSSKTGGFDDH